MKRRNPLVNQRVSAFVSINLRSVCEGVWTSVDVNEEERLELDHPDDVHENTTEPSVPYIEMKKIQFN